MTNRPLPSAPTRAGRRILDALHEAAGKKTNAEIARNLKVDVDTVSKYRKIYNEWKAAPPAAPDPPAPSPGPAPAPAPKDDGEDLEKELPPTPAKPEPKTKKGDPPAPNDGKPTVRRYELRL